MIGAPGSHSLGSGGGICGAAPSTHARPLRADGDWSYEVKWDGFRAIVSTEGAPLRARSRRGWDMTDLSSRS